MQDHHHQLEEGDLSHHDYTETHSQDTMRGFDSNKRPTDENDDKMLMGLQMISLQTVEGGAGLDGEHSPDANGYTNLPEEEDKQLTRSGRKKS